MRAERRYDLVNSVRLPRLFSTASNQARECARAGAMRTRRGAVQANAAPQSKREQRLLSSLSTYGAYHASPWNKIVHIVFVPAIWWCATLRAMLAGLFASRTRRQRRSAALALQATGPLEGAVGYAAARARGTKPCDG